MTAVTKLATAPLCRYRKGQRFGRHIDDSVELGDGLYTAYTLLIYLTRCEGGETGAPAACGLNWDLVLQGHAVTITLPPCSLLRQ